jgi:hypothetical protein
MYGNTIYDATITSSVTVCFDAIRHAQVSIIRGLKNLFQSTDYGTTSTDYCISL